MKKISIVVPTFNEADNVVLMGQALTKVMQEFVEKYDYEIIFIDNCSQDDTQMLLERMCSQDKKIKAIFNAKNFGQFNSPYYGLLQASGDCVILVCADFQDPLEMLSKFILEWENGYKIVIGKKTSSQESRWMYFLRSCYYKLIKRFSDVEQIEHFTGFGLYDREFINVLKNLQDPTPFLRGIVAELGFSRKEISYIQQKRKGGKSHNNFYSLYDAAMLSFTSYTKVGLRMATFLGMGVALISFIFGVIYLVRKCLHWYMFDAGMAPILIAVCFLGAVQLIFLGLIGEYVLSINIRTMKRPLVVEEKRLNFDSGDLVEDDRRG